ncbi:MAG: DUF4827 domain-containing protein [Bacteroidaceae bacterium]|nr:DUF4827 domain-containing protein [Bacteroidaceae bacterium]
MRRFIYLLSGIVLTTLTLLCSTSCHDSETYAEMRKKEKRAIARFIDDNDICGKIKVISEEEFYAKDSVTDTVSNEFVLFNDDGIYMQIVRRGEGSTMREMAKANGDSTINRTILCRFMEYDIEAGDSTYTNYYSPSIVDKMLCNYNDKNRTFSASFTEGMMSSRYGSNVPTGWIKPLTFVRLTRYAGKIAKVRLIVPHASGTTNASNYVLPCYYEITYQLGKN